MSGIKRLVLTTAVATAVSVGVTGVLAVASDFVKGRLVSLLQDDDEIRDELRVLISGWEKAPTSRKTFDRNYEYGAWVLDYAESPRTWVLASFQSDTHLGFPTHAPDHQFILEVGRPASVLLVPPGQVRKDAELYRRLRTPTGKVLGNTHNESEGE